MNRLPTQDTSVPWLTRDRRVVRDRAEVRKMLATTLKEPDPRWEALEVSDPVPYAMHRKDIPDESGRKLLDEVLGEGGWIVVLSAKEFLSLRYLLVRQDAGVARVVGGPYRFTFLLRPNEIPDVAREALRKPEGLELISLDPDFRAAKPKPGDDFHGWKVLGRTALKEKEVQGKLAAAVIRGAEESEGAAAACFNPRHGLRLTRGGKTVDLVICFECLQVQVYGGEKREKGFLTSASPEAVFDKALKEAGVPLAEKSKE